MSQPAVNITERDGALGTLPPGDKIHAAVGVASSGSQNLPATFAKTKDIISTFGFGPLVEYACAYVTRTNKPILIVRTGQSTAGLPGTLVTSGVAGTSVVTLGATAPNDDYELYFVVIAGGTIGVTGITVQYSYDGGRTLSPVTALGTANTFVFPNSGGVHIDFAAGTLLAGDYVTTRTTAPAFSSAELSAALAPLVTTAVNWREVHVVGICHDTDFDAVETVMASLSTAGKPKYWIGNTRVPNIAESEATYLTSLTGTFGAKASVYADLCAGACKLAASGNAPGRTYKRPASWTVAIREGAVSDEIDVADVTIGALPGTSIVDSNGNVDEHNESNNPGLDDARFTVLRTWDGVQGVYVNRPRIFSAAGSDFFIVPHRRVMNLAREAARLYLVKRLNRPVLVNTQTGFILEEEAAEIEDGLDAAIRAVLMATPKASGGGYAGGKFAQVSRTDNLLSTRTLTASGKVVPLAYIEAINFDISFFNPALLVQAA